MAAGGCCAVAALAAPAVGRTVPAGMPHTGAAAPTAYVANFIAGTVTPIDTATNTPGPAITVAPGPEEIAITPNGATAGTVTPLRTATNRLGKAIAVDSPDAIAITPDRATAYVADDDSAAVTPIDTATKTAGTPIPVGSGPSAIAITP